MPSELLDCLFDGCSAQRAVDNAINLVIPLILDFVIFSVLITVLVRRRDERRWSSSRNLLYSRLLLTIDRLLLQLAPIPTRSVAPRSVRFGEVAVDVAFEWTQPPVEDELVREVAGAAASWQRSAHRVVSHAAERLSRVIQAYGGHLDSRLMQLLVDLETNIELLEDDLAATSALDRETREAHKTEHARSVADALLAADRLRRFLVSVGEERAVVAESTDVV